MSDKIASNILRVFLIVSAVLGSIVTCVDLWSAKTLSFSEHMDLQLGDILLVFWFCCFVWTWRTPLWKS
jgi:hypothetical protein